MKALRIDEHRPIKSPVWLRLAADTQDLRESVIQARLGSTMNDACFSQQTVDEDEGIAVFEFLNEARSDWDGDRRGWHPPALGVALDWLELVPPAGFQSLRDAGLATQIVLVGLTGAIPPNLLAQLVRHGITLYLLPHLTQ